MVLMVSDAAIGMCPWMAEGVRSLWFSLIEIHCRSRHTLLPSTRTSWGILTAAPPHRALPPAGALTPPSHTNATQRLDPNILENPSLPKPVPDQDVKFISNVSLATLPPSN